MSSKLISIKEAARLLSVSTKTLRRWDDEGTLKAIKTVGGHRRYLQDDIDKYMGITKNEYTVIESLLDLNNENIRGLYYSWDKGDCSLIGLIEILLYQEIKKHKDMNGSYYDTDYDQIKLRIK